MRALAIAIVLAGGCGGSEELTCELLADPTNCWASAAADAAACLPAMPAVGTLRADRTGCDFANGGTVRFDQPLPMRTEDLDHLTFDVTGPGCSWRFTDTFQNRMELTVGIDTEVSELHPDDSFHLHCSGGTDYETSFDTLFTCQPPARPPTDGFEVTPTSFSFTISAVTVGTTLFTCAL